MASNSAPEPSVLTHGAAGAASSVLALALLYPLDQIRTLSQLGMLPLAASETNRRRYGERLGCVADCIDEQGIEGMYRGIGPSCLGENAP